MARQLDAQQLKEFSAFLEELFQLGGFKTDAEWSRQSGVHPVNLSTARNGHGGLDGYNLFRLIRAVQDRVGEGSLPQRRDEVADRLAALEEQVGGLARAEAVQLGFEALEAAIAERGEERKRPVPRKRTKKAG